MVKGLCDAALCHTTSEPSGGNAGSGAPVTASMSGSCGCNQGGTVEYILYPTPDLSGVGFLHTCPQY